MNRLTLSNCGHGSIRSKIATIFLLILVHLYGSGCSSTGTITVNVPNNAGVFLVDIEKTDSGGEPLSGTPIKIATDRLNNKALRIEEKGKVPQVWYFNNWNIQNKQNLALTPRLLDMPKADNPNSEKPSPQEKNSEKGKSAKDEGNQEVSLRMVMKSYYALTAERYEEAREIAAGLTRISPKFATPYILKGLAYLQEGDQVNARAAFETARSLDPTDPEIGQLIDAAK